MKPRWYPIPRRLPVAAPAAGAELSQLNDSGGMWVVRSLIFTLTTDANVANRVVSVAASGGGDTWFRTTCQNDQAATQARVYCGFNGGPSSTADEDVMMFALPHDGLWVPPGHTIASITTGIQATDQYSAAILSLIELPETVPSSLMPMVTTFTEEDGP